MNEAKKDKLYKLISVILSFGLLVLGVLLVFSPIITYRDITVTPYNFMISLDITDLDFGYLSDLIASYYINKYYFLLYSVVLVIITFLMLYYFVTKNKKLYQSMNNIMLTAIIIIFVAMLLGLNYINLYQTISSGYEVGTSMYYYFIGGLLIFLAKLALDIFLGKKYLNDEIKDSGLSIASSFVIMFFVITAIFFPLYIFPGTRYRVNGLDVLIGENNILDFLPMTSTYIFLIIFMLSITLVSFVINIFLFIKRRKIFVFYNRVNILFGIISLSLYALMGLNYIIVYIDAKAFATYYSSSINTYSYMPVLLYALYRMGIMISRMTASNMNVEYKIYAKDERGAESVKTAGEQNVGIGNGDSIDDPIPAFLELDRKVDLFREAYERRLADSFTDVTLPKLVKHIIEYARYSQDRLSYGPVEIKTFIAGLAASKLTILQGMSGTGKTSLPKIFMEAIDGICDLVAVESSWRDKNELLGFYSEFKRKYTPKSFTQFLYKATLNKDIPYFIVLDEMNLSRIEYYFSDFLSIMESRENDRHIKLFDIQLYPHNGDNPEYLGLRDGHTIDIPKNVWFIGTANRDESTFEITDKVYDRAQTMNFNKRAAKVYVTENINYPQKFVSYQKLRQLFDETKAVGFDAENNEVIHKVENLLKPYNISFGNRILNQIETFVNAYVSCSEIESVADQNRYIHEAVDCIIFSKVVRKLELKQIIDIDLLIEEFENLGLSKCVEFLRSLVENI